MISAIFEQIDTQLLNINDTKDHVIITFPKTKNFFGGEFKFNLHRGEVVVHHPSHAVIACVTNKTAICNGVKISANNKIFDWLNIPYTIEFKVLELASSKVKSGIISFF